MALHSFLDEFHHDKWASGGPDLLQKSLLAVCGFGTEVPRNDSIRITKERFNEKRCGGVSVLENEAFFPYGWRQHERLFDRKTKNDWYKTFQHSYAVHFYHSSSKHQAKYHSIMRPKYHGARKPAYLVLALDHCPVAYWSKDVF